MTLFPTKDAITTALIEREPVSVVAEVNAALSLEQNFLCQPGARASVRRSGFV